MTGTLFSAVSFSEGGRGSSALVDAISILSASKEWKHQVISIPNHDGRRYAEHELYTLYHYKQHEPTDGRTEKVLWNDYVKMNAAYTDQIVKQYQKGDFVWVHDYHLSLVPAMIRQQLPNARVGFFLHIPFPSSEFTRCLPRRKEILEGMLGANLVGFQSSDYQRHFLSCCKRILGLETSADGIDANGFQVAVDVFPIGIHASSTYKAAFETAIVEEKMKGLSHMYGGKKIIVGRDRLDPVRGVAQKFQAFEVFLDNYPEWHGKVVLIQVTSPTSIEEHDDPESSLSMRISEIVSRINGNYGSLTFTPVLHYPQFVSKEEYLALLRIADVGLITSVRDGMNTTSLEYVICQKDNHGPLILSEFSGTAESLDSAITINPWDLAGVAAAIDKALRMTASERETLQKKLYRHVTENNVEAWTTRFLHRLQDIAAAADVVTGSPLLDKTLLLSVYRSAKKRLFMFDYDGTLTPIVRDPGAAIPSDRVLRNLKSLAAEHRNAVWLISGRDQKFLDEWMGHIPELGLSAEHGSFIRHPMSKTWQDLTTTIDMSWQEEVMEVFGQYTEKTQGSFIERKKVAVTWHYRRADPEFGAHQAKLCKKQLDETVAKKYDVEVMVGKANLEVRPSFVNKGEIVKHLIAETADEVTPGDGPLSASDKAKIAGAKQLPRVPDFAFCAGDDTTDEDMFRALNESTLAKESFFACTVGPSSKKTCASWHLLEPNDVITSIGMLNEAAGEDWEEE